MTTTETQTKTARRAAPATDKAAPAQPAPAKAAPAKKAPAKAAPAATPTTAAPKLRWQVEGDRNRKGGKEQTAKVGDTTYAITKAGEGWKATVTVDGGKAQVLSDTTFAKAYNACVQHNRAR